MSVKFLALPSNYPTGISVDNRKTIVEGQLLPYDSSNALVQLLSFSITSNEVTFTTSPNSFTTGGGDDVFIAGFEGALAYLNGAYTTTSATSSTLVVPLTHANVASTVALGLATLAPNYASNGLALGGFYGLNGQPKAVGTLGPNSTPHYLDVKSLIGTRQYPVNINVQPPLILSYTLAGVQATGGSALPADSIGFRAEFTKESF